MDKKMQIYAYIHLYNYRIPVHILPTTQTIVYVCVCETSKNSAIVIALPHRFSRFIFIAFRMQIVVKLRTFFCCCCCLLLMFLSGFGLTLFSNDARRDGSSYSLV